MLPSGTSAEWKVSRWDWTFVNQVTKSEAHVRSRTMRGSQRYMVAPDPDTNIVLRLERLHLLPPTFQISCYLPASWTDVWYGMHCMATLFLKQEKRQMGRESIGF
jgi:hypothetical protein